MDACYGVSCTNVIYKHIYHGEYATCTSCLNGVKKIVEKIGEIIIIFKIHNMWLSKTTKKHFIKNVLIN